MADNDRIKVVGYAQRTFFDNGIEYRNFSDDLVGNQQTSDADGINSTFTFSNFVTTVNYEGRESRIFSTKKFTDFYCLDNLGLDEQRVNKLLNNNINVTLNVDRTDLCNFAYFGSATEYVRVSLENIITNWPASLYLNPVRSTDIRTIYGNTFSDYVYDATFNTATFKVDTNFINNKFDINYLKNGTIVDTFNEGNDLRNLTINYLSYVIFYGDEEYELLGFTGSTTQTDDYIYFKVKGDPFANTLEDTIEYHIKPKKEFEEEFFNDLGEFESYLLNRLSNPKFTSTYKFKLEAEDGSFVDTTKDLTWPVTDGYNIDYNTTQYVNFVSDLVQATNGKDASQTNLMVRFLTSESISDFDTVPRCDGTQEETAGQKMNKTLKIYGREYDEIKKYIDGISFANVVTYNKKENTPDQLVKYLARVLGWELSSSLLENDLIKNYLKVGPRTYAGHSRGLTPNEAEIEMWRRLILNSAHIWKSKGTRNPIEFFFKFIGAPDGLINFNEHVYVAKRPIDMDIFYAALEANGLEDDLNLYNVDADGYPKFFRDDRDMWFQKGGGWYRQTAGSGATQYTLQGNNPHIGPYDSGYEYIAQLENIIPGFSAFTLTSTTITSGSSVVFTNYNKGIVNGYGGEVYVKPINSDSSDARADITGSVIQDPCPTAEQTDCGCDIPENDESLLIDVSKLQVFVSNECDDKIRRAPYNNSAELYRFQYWDRSINGEQIVGKWSVFASQECCSYKTNDGNSFYHEEYINNNPQATTSDELDWELDNVGYICCRSRGLEEDLERDGCGCYLSRQWVLAGASLNDMYRLGNSYYLKYVDPAGNFRVVNTADSCMCDRELTTSEIIEDPYTGEMGYACKLIRTDDTDILTAILEKTFDLATTVYGREKKA